MAKKIKLVEGKTYYNPFKEESFTVLSLDYGRDKVRIKCKDGEIKERSISILQPLVQKTIEAKMDGFQQNLGKDNWSVFLKTLNCEDQEKANSILDKIKDEYVDTDIPLEWQGSKHEWFYRLIGNSTKGMVARKLYLGLMESFGREVDKETDGDYLYSSKEYSGIVDERKKLVKVACIKEGSKITFNNIRQFQNWDDIVFVCMFPDNIMFFESEKTEFIERLKNNPSEIIWAGGQEKKDRLGGDIEKNDYFHWIIDFKVLNENLEEIE